MKRILLCTTAAAFLLSCGDPNSGNQNQSTESGGSEQSQTNAVAGEQLISQSDCMSCHNIDATIIGPSYQEVAEKYEATDENIEMLAQKIIKGGAGNWGDVPMTPHPTVSEDDAKAMVKYIFSLKK